jgi:hypothetical protein
LGDTLDVAEPAVLWDSIVEFAAAWSRAKKIDQNTTRRPMLPLTK